MVTIKELLVKHLGATDVITIEFARSYDSEVTVYFKEVELFSLPTKMDCTKYDLDFTLQEDEVLEVKKLFRLLRKMINLIVKYNEDEE